jgi:hypothetical protein
VTKVTQEGCCFEADENQSLETRTTQTSDDDYGGGDHLVLKIRTSLTVPVVDFHFQGPSTRGSSPTFQSPALFDRLKNCHIEV